MDTYKKWRIERWNTPLSDIESVALASLSDSAGQLAITIEAPRQPGRPRWEIIFDTYPAYRNLLEEFRLQLWDHLDATKQRCGNTFLVTTSPWIETLRHNEALFEHHHPTVSHYVILTEDDVLEILSPTSPIIKSIGNTPNDHAPAGKSTVLYNSEDRDKIEEMLSQLKHGNSDG